MSQSNNLLLVNPLGKYRFTTIEPQQFTLAVNLEVINNKQITNSNSVQNSLQNSLLKRLESKASGKEHNGEIHFHFQPLDKENLELLALLINWLHQRKVPADMPLGAQSLDLHFPTEDRVNLSGTLSPDFYEWICQEVRSDDQTVIADVWNRTWQLYQTLPAPPGMKLPIPTDLRIIRVVEECNISLGFEANGPSVFILPTSRNNFKIDQATYTTHNRIWTLLAEFGLLQIAYNESLG